MEEVAIDHVADFGRKGEEGEYGGGKRLLRHVCLIWETRQSGAVELPHELTGEELELYQRWVVISRAATESVDLNEGTAESVILSKP